MTWPDRPVVCEPRGRHQYYRLADAEVAHALEALAIVAERDGHDKAWKHPDRQRLRYARCCYGHLAGWLGVSVFDTLQQGGYLQSTASGFELTPAGGAWLNGLGLNPSLPGSRRCFAYRCLDCSERRDHLAGQLADEIYRHFTAMGWVRRTAGRAVEIPGAASRSFSPVWARTQSEPDTAGVHILPGPDQVAVGELHGAMQPGRVLKLKCQGLQFTSLFYRWLRGTRWACCRPCAQKSGQSWWLLKSPVDG